MDDKKQLKRLVAKLIEIGLHGLTHDSPHSPSHKQRLFARLQLSSRLQAFRQCFGRGVIVGWEHFTVEAIRC